jgi:hypothetical protein
MHVMFHPKIFHLAYITNDLYNSVGKCIGHSRVFALGFVTFYWMVGPLLGKGKHENF